MNKKPRPTLQCGRPAQAPARISPAEVAAYRQKLSHYLSKSGGRFTEPRWQVALAILDAGRHLDSGAIVERVKRTDPRIGAATVYRAIKLLCDAGILEESHQGATGKTVYELCGDEHHDHIVCSDCGAVFEFHDRALEKAQEEIASKEGFKLEGHRHVLMGRCAWLSKENSPKNKGARR